MGSIPLESSFWVGVDDSSHVNVPYSLDLAICASSEVEIVRSASWSVVWMPAHLLAAAPVEELLVHGIHDGHFVWRRVCRERVVLLLQDLFEQAV